MGGEPWCTWCWEETRLVVRLCTVQTTVGWFHMGCKGHSVTSFSFIPKKGFEIYIIRLSRKQYPFFVKLSPLSRLHSQTYVWAFSHHWVSPFRNSLLTTPIYTPTFHKSSNCLMHMCGTLLHGKSHCVCCCYKKPIVCSYKIPVCVHGVRHRHLVFCQ